MIRSSNHDHPGRNGLNSKLIALLQRGLDAKPSLPVIRSLPLDADHFIAVPLTDFIRAGCTHLRYLIPSISRGVEESKISVVPNAVDAEVVRNESDLFNEMKDQLEDKLVVGYIGSLRELEGVDLTAKAVSILKEKGFDVNLFVLSSQSGQNELRAYCNELGITEDSHIVGPVPHDQVAPFYDLIDVFVVSRPDLRVTRLVTPLKPFEAMRSGTAVVMADLPALAEIVENGKTGCLYPAGDSQKLADKIHELMTDKSIREIGRKASSWVIANRTWQSVIRYNTLHFEK